MGIGSWYSKRIHNIPNRQGIFRNKPRVRPTEIVPQFIILLNLKAPNFFPIQNRYSTVDQIYDKYIT